MQYAAVAISNFISTGDFIGRVAEAYTLAALLEFGDESRVALLAPKFGRQPHAISLDAPADPMRSPF